MNSVFWTSKNVSFGRVLAQAVVLKEIEVNVITITTSDLQAACFFKQELTEFGLGEEDLKFLSELPA